MSDRREWIRSRARADERRCLRTAVRRQDSSARKPRWRRHDSSARKPRGPLSKHMEKVPATAGSFTQRQKGHISWSRQAEDFQ